MQFGVKLALVALGGISILMGCQTAEPVNNPATTDPAREGNPPNGQSREGDLNRASQLIKPDAATLEEFLSKRGFVEPDLQIEVPGGEDHVHTAAPLAKTSALQACNINFNSSAIINTVPNKAWDTFAYSPHYNITCGSGIANKFWIYTLPQSYNHYHLSYEDPYVCYDVGTPKKMGRYTRLPGYKKPGSCDIVDWDPGVCSYNATDAATLPRRMHPHAYNDWVKIYAIDANTRARRNFNIKSIYLPPNAQAACAPEYGKIQLWIKVAATQQWYYWTWINPGWTFVPGPGDIQTGLDEMQITSATNYGWTVDDIKIDVQY